MNLQGLPPPELPIRSRTLPAAEVVASGAVVCRDSHHTTAGIYFFCGETDGNLWTHPAGAPDREICGDFVRFCGALGVVAEQIGWGIFFVAILWRI